MTMKMGELFAGYGGLGLGVQAVLDAELTWVSEIDRGANKILEHRFPGVPNIGDITTIDWATVEPVDILTGGSPCQDLSHAGRRKGMTEGTRSNLWVAMREAIAALRPSLVIWENVRGAYSAAADSEMEPCTGCLGGARDRGPSLRALGRVLGDLSELGYVGGWHGLRAADVGAPHGRFRVFVTAHLADAERIGRQRGPATLRSVVGVGEASGEPDRPATPALLPTPLTTDGKVNASPGMVGRHTPPLGAISHLLPTPAVNDMGDRPWANPETWDAWVAKHKAAGINGNGHGKSLAIEAQRLLPTPTAVTRERSEDEIEQRRATRTNGLNLDDIRPSEWGIYADAIARWEALTRPAPAPTQPSKKGAPQLSPLFSEWLMGLPEGHVTSVPGLSRNDQLKALGNGVVPAQAAAAVRFLLNVQEAAA